MQMLVRLGHRKEWKKLRADFTRLEQLAVSELLILDQQTIKRKLQSMVQTAKEQFSTTLFRVQLTCGLKTVANKLIKKARVKESKAKNTMTTNISFIIQTYQIQSMLIIAPRSPQILKMKGKSTEQWMQM